MNEQEKEYKEKYQKFQNKFGKMIINIFENSISFVDENFGRDFSAGFTMGLDTIYLAITGHTMKEDIDFQKEE